MTNRKVLSRGRGPGAGSVAAYVIRCALSRGPIGKEAITVNGRSDAETPRIERPRARAAIRPTWNATV